MTAPRPVFPGRILSITRTCTQRQFLLRPDELTNEAFTYCLAEAARTCGVELILSMMEGNHHHSLVYDPHGREVEFRERLHKMVAKVQNARFNRTENLWSSCEPCVVEVADPTDLLDQPVYIATNPVKDHLVERVHHWPGPNFVKALLTGTRIVARRPRHFFRKDGTMPLEIELEMKLPDHIEGKAALLAELARRISEVEETLIIERRRTGRKIFGRGRVLRQSWRSSPTSERPRGSLRPRLAAKNPERRTMLLKRNAQWRSDYRSARSDLMAGVPTIFPFGTYWLRRFANVQVGPPEPPYCC